jgi:hypothetical protein
MSDFTDAMAAAGYSEFLQEEYGIPIQDDEAFPLDCGDEYDDEEDEDQQFDPERMTAILKWLRGTKYAVKIDGDHSFVVQRSASIRLMDGSKVVLWEWLVSEGFVEGAELEGFRVVVMDDEGRKAAMIFCDLLETAPFDSLENESAEHEASDEPSLGTQPHDSDLPF